MEPTKELSFGEKLASTTFNPSNDGDVDKVKQTGAVFMNSIESAWTEACANPMSPIRVAIWDQAKVRALEAQMLAVKAITWKY